MLIALAKNKEVQDLLGFVSENQYLCEAEELENFKVLEQSAYQDILKYLSDRGFRESNYEIIELTKWLRDKIKNSERRYE